MAYKNKKGDMNLEGYKLYKEIVIQFLNLNRIY